MGDYFAPEGDIKNGDDSNRVPMGPYSMNHNKFE